MFQSLTEVYSKNTDILENLKLEVANNKQYHVCKT